MFLDCFGTPNHAHMKASKGKESLTLEWKPFTYKLVTASLSIDICFVFNSLRQGAWLAQLLEHGTYDLRVVSSSPTLSVEPTNKEKE